ncbi:MAG: hypothetical protein D6699_05895 [Aquificota bacterium]|nr:MAG: hypothetical protein D6699_05895 [Aquificota bacterium]
MIKSLLFLHLVFATLWIGGMIYSLFFLRPALGAIGKEPQKELLKRVFGRFFLAVWLSIVVLFFTGMALWHGYRRDFTQNPLFHLKLFLFALMVLVFSYIYFFLYRKENFKNIPTLIGVNLLLGLFILLIISYIS